MDQQPLTVHRKAPSRRWGAWTATCVGVLLLVAGLLLALTRIPIDMETASQAREDAAGAIQALRDGDLAALDESLSANLGQADFAFFFTSQADPRALGDALATVAGTNGDTPFEPGLDPHAYDLALTDLAGTLALATHGTGDRALPKAWTEHFIEATTTPQTLYGEDDGDSAEASTARANQAQANKQNLLLLLSRGYWSTDFLKAATASYWAFDHDQDGDAWPSSTLDDARYAPAPSGTYLTDGILALTAALTTNPAASEWAFTEFEPGTEEIDGSEYTVGKFTHYLLFEHSFPETSSGESIGITATLTALLSASDSITWAVGTQAAGSATASSKLDGPVHDVAVLQALAQDLKDARGCSWSPVKYGHCARAVTRAVWDWIEHWGHVVLGVLSAATFAPPPFNLVGIASAATNATWYSIEGDYGAAGLSLAATVPGLRFAKNNEGPED